MTLEELAKIRAEKADLVAVRRLVKEKAEEMAAKTAYR